jgi:hypothetical protein
MPPAVSACRSTRCFWFVCIGVFIVVSVGLWVCGEIVELTRAESLRCV